MAHGIAIAVLPPMRLAATIVLTTFVLYGVAHAGHGSGAQKKPRPARKTGVKFLVDQVNKDGQVVERLIVEGPLGKTRGKQRQSRELTIEEDLKAANKGKAVEEVAAEMPSGDLTLKGRLASAGSVTSMHNGSTTTRTRLRRTGSGFDPVVVETRVHRAGKMRRIREAGKVIEEPLMLGKGGGVVEPVFVQVPSGEGEDGEPRWGGMSGSRLDFQTARPYSVLMFVSAGTSVPIDRDQLNQAVRTGKAGKGDIVIASDGEHVTVTATVSGQRSEYRMPHEQVKSFLASTYRSVPRGDESRWANFDGLLSE